MPAVAWAQAPSDYTPPSDSPPAAADRTRAQSDFLEIRTDLVYSWNRDGSVVLELPADVELTFDRATLRAGRGVLFIEPLPGGGEARRLRAVLLDGVELVHQQATRTDDTLVVEAVIEGPVRLASNRRIAQDRSGSALFRRALAQLERESPPPAAPPTAPQPAAPALDAPGPLSPEPLSPEPLPPPPLSPAASPVVFRAGQVETTRTDEGFIAVVLTGDVTIIRKQPDGQLLELQADRGVLYTTLTALADLQAEGGQNRVESAVEAAYLEGGVRVLVTPAARTESELRLRADRVYYAFATDRAVLTDAVLHTTDPRLGIPVTVRAQTVRQLSQGEIEARTARLSTSSFFNPSYELASDRIFIRRLPGGGGTPFSAANNTLRAYGVPFFYFPYVAGNADVSGLPLRSFGLGNSRSFGFGVLTEFGLFETLGVQAPEGVDASYKLDYFSDRGFAGGLDATYRGGFIGEDTRQPWTYEGRFTSYGVINDDGLDQLGGTRFRVDPDEDFRYRASLQHQSFFPNDWQFQASGGLVSDPTFLEEWFERDFDTGLTEDLQLYLKRQRGTEAATGLVVWNWNDQVTRADQFQNYFTPSGLGPQFADPAGPPFETLSNFTVERLPEIGYRRLGEPLGEDFTFYSTTTLANLRFKEVDDPLTGGFGYAFNPGNPRLGRVGGLPGVPAVGYTGTTDDFVVRFDTRNQIDWPIALGGSAKAVPYVLGRLTSYSDSPDSGGVNRLLAGAGVRFSSQFWRTYESLYSKLLDVDRVRHVVEPRVDLFAAVSGEEREDVYIFDQDVGGASAISAINFGVNQRWQTKRGGPGRLRTVDVFTLDASITYFGDEPDEPVGFDIARQGGFPLTADGFRGLYFSSLPEASLPRDHARAFATWRVSDTTVLLGDVNYNLDAARLATAAVGLAVERGDRIRYFLGGNYTGEINSTVGNVAFEYRISEKYQAQLATSVNFGDETNTASTLTLVRRFDGFIVTGGFYLDNLEDEGGIKFSITPTGFGYEFDSVNFFQGGRRR